MIHEVINKILLPKISMHTDKDTTVLKYLEIGVDTGHTFSRIEQKTQSGADIMKVGVDPYGVYQEGVTRMTSQMYFAINERFWHQTFDVIYIDGCHFSPIVDQEIYQSLKILNPNGVIILDDTVAPTKESQMIDAESLSAYCEKVSYPANDSHTEAVPLWPGYPRAHGDVWKSVAKLRMTRPDLSICSLLPLCVSFIMRGEQELIEDVSSEEMDWEYYLKYKDIFLNPVGFIEDVIEYMEKNIT